MEGNQGQQSTASEVEKEAVSSQNIDQSEIIAEHLSPKADSEAEGMTAEERKTPPTDVYELTSEIMKIINEDKTGDGTPLNQGQLLKSNMDLQEFIVKLIQLLEEKTNLCTNLDRQNTALISQAKSLKDVIAITKDLLSIRNMEVEHLHADMQSMEQNIKDERTRHNLAVQRLSEAMTLNDKLKTEYLTQMELFTKLRDKYNEKVMYLTKENQRLNEVVKALKGTSTDENHESESVENEVLTNGVAEGEVENGVIENETDQKIASE